MQLSGPWTREEASASGQVFEFRLWALLTEQSRGLLHVFLPLADRGVDALVHRRTDGVYMPVQAKARSTLKDGEVHLVVWAESVAHDDTLLVSGLITEGGLGPTMLVVPERDFRRLAELSTWDGRPVYSMGFGMQPRSDSRWLPHLVPAARLAERFGIAAEQLGAPEAPSAEPERRNELGFLGEAEVARVLAENGELNLFRAFPDLETSELVAMNVATRRVVGIQIKTIGVSPAQPAGSVMILASSFRTSPSTVFVVVAWRHDERRFDDECLLIPSEDVRRICEPTEHGGHLAFDWHPRSPLKTQLDPYRRSLDDLARQIV